ncbi:MAG: thermonuclease family protein [Mycoplasmataceae bacterium]|nr:thermonuclease family protein [Mycoplasmataceae bacterium]
MESVHDGDTFKDTKGRRYRLFGVDTPEVSDQYHGFAPTDGIEGIYGTEATILARKLILHKTVKVNTITTDPYGRVVAIISINGIDLASELLKNGLARIAYLDVKRGSRYYTNKFLYYRRLLELQHTAYIEGVGLWKHKDLFKQIFPKS